MKNTLKIILESVFHVLAYAGEEGLDMSVHTHTHTHICPCAHVHTHAHSSLEWARPNPASAGCAESFIKVAGTQGPQLPPFASRDAHW